MDYYSSLKEIKDLKVKNRRLKKENNAWEDLKE